MTAQPEYHAWKKAFVAERKHEPTPYDAWVASRTPSKQQPVAADLTDDQIDTVITAAVGSVGTWEEVRQAVRDALGSAPATPVPVFESVRDAASAVYEAHMAATPVQSVPASEPQDAVIRVLLCRLVDQLGERDRGGGNAPGHGHDVPGVWDSDNGAKAGTACAWCALWAEAKKVRASLAATPAPTSAPANQDKGEGA